MTNTHKIATEVGVIGGTLSGVVATYSNDIFKTVLFAAIGAATSFFVTVILKWLSKKIFKK